MTSDLADSVNYIGAFLPTNYLKQKKDLGNVLTGEHLIDSSIVPAAGNVT